MKKYLGLLLIAIFFVSFAMVIVLAENDTVISGNGNDNVNFVISTNDNTTNTNNMTFGKCVVDAVKLRQDCYSQNKNVSKECINTAKVGKDKKQARTCLSDYKQSKKSCMASFKEAKITCIQTYKPKFWARMKSKFA